jgi:peptidoglycan hydrolase CwlO-like protein
LFVFYGNSQLQKQYDYFDHELSRRSNDSRERLHRLEKESKDFTSGIDEMAPLVEELERKARSTEKKIAQLQAKVKER